MVVSYSISTSNHNLSLLLLMLLRLYLIPFLHQTTTKYSDADAVYRCILFHFYIKPQQRCRWCWRCRVVSYSISTSNHNLRKCPECSNRLYLIPFLHQTTTSWLRAVIGYSLYLIPFLHQTTTAGELHNQSVGCILFHFYIKPQLSVRDG